MRLRLGRPVAVLLLVLGLLGCAPPPDPIRTPLTEVANIQLPRPTEGGSPSLDLLTADPRNHLLYVPYTNAMNVVDMASRKVIGTVGGLPGIKSIALSPDSNVVFTGNGGNNTVAVINVTQLKVTEEIKTPLGNPDAIAFDPVNNVVVVAQSGPSPNVAYIDVLTHKVIGTTSLPGGPELIATDPKGGRVFVALHDKDAVAVVDIHSRQITATYKGCDIKSPVGMAFDADQGRLFVANGIIHSANVVSVVDILLDKCLGSIDIGHGPDQAAVNGHLHHLYVTNSGTSNLSVIDTASLKPLGVNGTGHAAHSVAVDPTTDTVYVGVERAGIVAVYHDP